MSEPLKLDPAIGDAVLKLVERETGRPCHIVLIASALEGDALGQPCFITSLHPDDMERFLIQVAGCISLAKERTVTGRPI